MDSPEERGRQLRQDASLAQDEEQGVVAELLGCQLLPDLPSAHWLAPVLGQHVCDPAQRGLASSRRSSMAKSGIPDSPGPHMTL